MCSTRASNTTAGAAWPRHVFAFIFSVALPENVNYAVESWYGGRCRAALVFVLRGTAALPFLESVPAVSAKLKAPVTADRKFEDVVKSARDAAVLVLIY
ncbi:MAG: hypothetical protein ABSE90_03410 [Verrucomicrobiota bacterium]